MTNTRAVRCAIYARMSTDKQSDTSPADQVARCREFAKARVWEVVEDLVVMEAGVSGASRHNRPGLLSLIHRMEEWDALLCFDFSRLTRNVEDHGWLLNRFRAEKRTAYEATTGLELSNLGAQVGGVMNAEYLDRLRAFTQNGLLRRAERGLATGGPPYGYRTDEAPGGRSLVVDVERAVIVRRIFDRYAAGDGLREIAHSLNADHVTPPRPRSLHTRPASWAPTAIREMLRNPIYRGLRVYNRSEWVKDHATGRRRRFERPESEWFREERPDLVVVSPDLFEAVQDEIGGRAEAYERTERARFAGTLSGQGHRVAARHVLSGFLECGVCGGAFHASNGSGRYGCAWHRKRGPAVCDSRLTVPRVTLEERIFGAIRDRILVPDVVTYATTRAVEKVAERLEGAKPVDLSERLSEIADELSTLRRIASRSSRPSDVGRLIAELEHERANLTAPRTAFTGIDRDLLRDVVTARVFEMRQAFEGCDEDRRAAFRVLLGDRRMSVCADPERHFRVEGVFELPLEEGDSRPWASRESPIRGSGGVLLPKRTAPHHVVRSRLLLAA